MSRFEFNSDTSGASTFITPALRRLIIIAVMSATLMQVLDTTIVNVALPHMQGTLGTTSNEITWVLTSYLVASAILMPMTGYFTDRLGRKKFLLVSIAGFVLTSALCGAAMSLTQIVFFRLLQGVFGAALVPLSQAIMTDVFPEEERGTAMAIWGMGVMIGPVLGPTLGGYLTEIASWRWNFYINIPFGILSLLLAWHVVPDTPVKQRDMDWVGLILISVAIGALQYFLDRGNQADWFASRDIAIAAFLTVICFLLFLLHIQHHQHTTVFDLVIFKDRNFTLCSMILTLLGLGLFGTMVIAPLMLENLFHYPVLTTGLMMAPRGISAMVSMMVIGKLIRHVDSRWLIICGIIISSIGMYLGTYYNLEMNHVWIVGPFILQGFGIGMIFVPLSALAFSTLSPSLRAEAAGIFSLLRTLGSSIGISIVITLFTRHTQMAWNHLGGFIHFYNPQVNQYLSPLHISSSNSLSIGILEKLIASQAQMISFINIYAFLTGSFLVMIPIVLFIKKMEKASLEIEILE